MIAVVIDIPMPDRCSQCPMCHDYQWCRATKEDRTIPDEIVCEGKPEWCPLEEVKTRQRGHWILDPNGMDWNLSAWVCSECHGRHSGLPIMDGVNERNIYQWAGSRYCPNCGAIMSGTECYGGGNSGN